jgi:hypothetical protein
MFARMSWVRNSFLQLLGVIKYQRPGPVVISGVQLGRNPILRPFTCDSEIYDDPAGEHGMKYALTPIPEFSAIRIYVPT